MLIYASDVFARIPSIVGSWYLPPDMPVSAGAAQGSTLARGIPLLVRRPFTVDQLGVRVTTNAAGNVQLALYNASQTTLMPTTLLGKTGSQSTASATVVAGALTDSGGSATTPRLSLGLYWLFGQLDSTASGNSVVCQGAASSFTAAFPALIGNATNTSVSAGAAALICAVSIANTFGSWGDLSGGSFSAVSSAANFLVMYRAA